VDKRHFCEAFLAAMNKGDLVALGAMLDPEFRVSEADGLPYPGVFRGIEGWQALAAQVRRTWSGLRVVPLEIHDAGEVAVLRLHLTGRGRETGTPIDTTVLELWRFRDDKLLEILPYYWDTHAAALAAGTAAAAP
jgi:ketosteroid isomerase-like protein